jgi:hypothetical protein
MNGSNLLDEADKKPFALCPICLRKIAVYLKCEMSLYSRYVEVEKQIKSIIKQEQE